MMQGLVSAWQAVCSIARRTAAIFSAPTSSMSAGPPNPRGLVWFLIRFQTPGSTRRPRLARGPLTKQGRQIDWPHATITVDVLRAALARPPAAEQDRQVKWAYDPIAFEVRPATTGDTLLIFECTHLNKRTAAIACVFSVQIINEPRVAVEICLDVRRYRRAVGDSD